MFVYRFLQFFYISRSSTISPYHSSFYSHTLRSLIRGSMTKYFGELYDIVLYITTSRFSFNILRTSASSKIRKVVTDWKMFVHRFLQFFCISRSLTIRPYHSSFYTHILWWLKRVSMTGVIDELYHIVLYITASRFSLNILRISANSLINEVVSVTDCEMILHRFLQFFYISRSSSIRENHSCFYSHTLRSLKREPMTKDVDKLYQVVLCMSTSQ